MAQIREGSRLLKFRGVKVGGYSLCLFFIMIDTKKTYTAYGHVDKDGKISIYNRSLLDSTVKQYFKKTSIELTISEKTKEFSDSMRAYYFGVVIKEVQKAYRSTGVVKTLKNIDNELRSMFLLKENFNEDKGEWEQELHTLRKGETLVTAKMMRDFIDLIIGWTIQVLDWAIPYPSEQMQEDDLTIKQRLTEHLDKSINETTF